MRYAVLINTNTSARQLKRTVDKLNKGAFDFYIHVDKKLNIKYYRQVLDLPNVYMVTNRVATTRGGFSMLKATLNGIEEILNSEKDYAFITLLSGSDYPIKSAEDIAAFFKKNHDKQFVSYTDNWYQTHQACTDDYHLIDKHFWGKRVAEKLMNLFFKRPHIPKNLKITGNSAYWTITTECALYVTKYIKRFKFEEFLQYTKNSYLFVFQSIIINSSFKDSVINNNYRYTKKAKDTGHSKTLTTQDFHHIISSDCLFASRFDIREDEKILAMIDEANNNSNQIKQPA